MKIIAIDSSSQVASVAILTDDIITAEYTVNHKITHSQTLMPMLDEVVRMTETDLSTVDAIAVSGGPGSFTGLRIGSATGKGLAQALDIPIIHIPTLEGMAYNAYGFDGIICPIMDARRSQVYTGIYSFSDGEMEVLMDGCAISIEELVERITDFDVEILFIGDGIPVFKEYLISRLSDRAVFAPANMNRQRAASVAALAAKYYEQGLTVEACEHLPEYLRSSQAEREREAKLLKEKNVD